MTDPGASAAAVRSNLRLALRFVGQRWGLIGATSVALLLPVFWHRRIEAGDLASHTYNAWLAQLIERGQAPGLYMAQQWTNFLVDVALTRLGSVFGFVVAEKVVVSVCVLIFFWGAFALVASATRRAPWFLVPAVAMIAYGWTFQMGFLNYYLSLGSGFLAVAALWRGRGGDWIMGLTLLAFTYVAHPMGFLCLTGIAGYVILAERLRSRQRWALLAASFVTVFAVHYYIVHHFRTQYSEASIFYLMNGADQLALYGDRYAKLAMAALLLGSVAFLYDRRREKGVPSRWRCRTPLELWAVLLFTAAMIPEAIYLPQYAAPLTFTVARLTSITAVMGLCILGSMRLGTWHLVGCSVVAAVFFFWLYQDTGALNRMEAQAQSLVATLPSGHRVAKTIWPPPGSRIYFINHLVDEACIGRCFAYSNYEPASRQFRVRVRAGSPIVTDSPGSVQAMDEGYYVVQPENLPMAEIFQCDAQDLTRLCMRDLTAGEKNGRVGYHPPGLQ